jgi:signal transduction histidine kinase
MPWADSEDFDADFFMEWDRRVAATGEPQVGVIEQLVAADGRKIWIETNKVPLRDLDGEVIGVLGTFSDVTDRLRTEEELQTTLEDLDARVQQRTAELSRANTSLRREVEDRVRLQAEERQQRAYAEALRDTASAMSKSLDLDEVCEQVLVGVERLISNDLTVLILVDADGNYELSTHRIGFEYDVPQPPVSRDTLTDLTVVDHMSRSLAPVILDSPPHAVGEARSVLGASMRVGDQLVGYVFVESATPGFYSERHMDRLETVADQGAAAISNSRLAARASEMATAEARQQLARELHDEVSQTLWTAALTAESLGRDVPTDSEIYHRVERLQRLTRGALAEMRSLLLELRPSELMNVQLEQLLAQLVTALECRRTLDVTVEVAPVLLTAESRLAYYRIAQGALANVEQHAEAASLSVRLSEGPPVELTISDDGSGFDPDDVPPGRLGLTIMKEWAESVGADLLVETGLEAGTTVRVRAAE